MEHNKLRIYIAHVHSYQNAARSLRNCYEAKVSRFGLSGNVVEMRQSSLRYSGSWFTNDGSANVIEPYDNHITAR